MIKVIPIEDLASSDIVNSVPASLTVYNTRYCNWIKFSGGLVYVSDLEGKITKLNLTNMSSDDNNGNILACMI